MQEWLSEVVCFWCYKLFSDYSEFFFFISIVQGNQKGEEGDESYFELCDNWTALFTGGEVQTSSITV